MSESIRILVLNDSMKSAVLWANVIRRRHPNWIVHSASKVEEAVHLLKKHRFDGVLTDRAPISGGASQINSMSVFRLARKINPVCVILVYHDKGEPFIRYEEAFKEGVTDVSHKAPKEEQTAQAAYDKFEHAFRHIGTAVESRERAKQSGQKHLIVRRLVLENVRSIKHLELDFTSPDDPAAIRKWTLLLSENGAGKSTVLRSIGLLFAGWEGLHQIMGERDGWIRNGATSARMEAVIETEDGEQRTLSLEIMRGMSPTEFIRHNNKGLAPLEAALANDQQSYFAAAYGASRRLPAGDAGILGSRGGKQISLPQRAQAMATLFSADAELNSLQSWAMAQEYEHGARGLVTIRKAIQELLPGVTFEKIDKREKVLLFKTPDGTVPLSRLSDGYQNMAGWIGDLLYRVTEVFSDLKNPLDARGLLLLDEMDLHLHPVWQRQLIAFLSKTLKNFQIIATTHSPLTAQQAGPGELHILERPAPRSAPVLRQFEGTPRLMRLEELAISPLFGLETAYSLEVENLRNQYKEEKARGTRRGSRLAKKAASRSARAEPDAAAQLARVSVKRTGTLLEERNQALLRKLDAALEKLPAAKARARRGK